MSILHARRHAPVGAAVGLAVAMLAACPPVGEDANDEPDAPTLCAEGTLGIAPQDIGTHCAGAAVAQIVVTADGFSLRATLPDGLSLVEVDGVWQLTGTVPTTADIVDASFEVIAEQPFADCLARETFRVGFFIDPCDGGDGTCGPFARPHPIAGYCLPDVVDADTPFALTTIAGVCLSSTCSEVRPALCDVVVEGDRVIVGGDVCVRDIDVGACSEDCSGGDGAPCAVPGLAAGTWVFVTAAGERTITIPRAPGNDEDRCLFP